MSTESFIKAEETKAVADFNNQLNSVKAEETHLVDIARNKAASLDFTLDKLMDNEVAATEGLFKRFLNKLKSMYHRILFWFVTNF